jgi:hypothetical protein
MSPNSDRDAPEERAGERKRITQLSLRSAVAVVLIGRWVSRQEQKDDPESPGIVSMDPRADQIWARARDLTREGREDQGAADELAALGKGHRRALRRAERASRLGGMHRESRSRNHAYRLLKAAVARGPLEPASTAEAELFDTLARSFDRERPRAEVWADLVEREPQLAQLETDVLAGRYGPTDEPTRQTSDELRDPDVQRKLGDRARLTLELTDRLGGVLGPNSTNPDPIIRSRMARGFADQYLQKLPRQNRA